MLIFFSKILLFILSVSHESLEQIGSYRSWSCVCAILRVTPSSQRIWVLMCGVCPSGLQNHNLLTLAVGSSTEPDCDLCLQGGLFFFVSQQRRNPKAVCSLCGVSEEGGQAGCDQAGLFHSLSAPSRSQSVRPLYVTHWA